LIPACSSGGGLALAALVELRRDERAAAFGRFLAERRVDAVAVGRVRRQQRYALQPLARGVVDDPRDLLLEGERQQVDAVAGHGGVGGEGDDGNLFLHGPARAGHAVIDQRADDHLGAVLQHRLRGGEASAGIGAGFARDQQQVGIIGFEQRQFRGVLE
jgi:hypothetical protein